MSKCLMFALLSCGRAEWSLNMGYYWLGVDVAMNYDSAVEYCSGQGSTIASPDNYAQNYFMAQQFPNQKIWYGHKCSSGCNEAHNWPGYGINGWTGSWANGQPNCGDSNCCARTQDLTDEWNGGDCEETYRFLCRRNTWQSAMGYKWLAVGAPMTHDSAVDFCDSQGSSIATPDDPQQNTFMAQQFPNEKIWFGHKCTGSGCIEPFSWPGYGSSNGWTGNWADGQPNCDSSNCVVCARTQYSGDEWNDGSCNDKYKFLCKRPESWYLGAKGESCDAVCEANSYTCDLAAMQGLDSESLRLVVEYIGVDCPKFAPSQNYPDLPGLEQGFCMPGSEATTCEATLAGTQRFCSCRQPQPWYLGAQGESCDAVCEAMSDTSTSYTCDLAAMQGLDSENLRHVVDYLGVTCPKFAPSQNYAELPGLEQEFCMPGSDKTTCEAAYASTQRFCSCSAAPTPSTTMATATTTSTTLATTITTTTTTTEITTTTTTTTTTTHTTTTTTTATTTTGSVVGYTRHAQSCVRGHNIAKHVGKSLTECAAICSATPNSVAFEYGVHTEEVRTNPETACVRTQSTHRDAMAAK